MGKLKLKNKIVIIITITTLCIVGVICYMSSADYIYADKLDQILGIESSVKIKDKTIADSWAMGEWYICETYDIEKIGVKSFSLGNLNNLLLEDEKNWVRTNWLKLPIDSIYNNAESEVFNYIANAEIDKRIKEMEHIISSNSGYYSFLCSPAFDAPQKTIFCLLDTVQYRLFIVDLKL